MKHLVEEFHSACQNVVNERTSPALNYAVGYAQAGGTMNDPKAIQLQCLYILNNITHWRGPIAKTTRVTFKWLAESKTWRAAA